MKSRQIIKHGAVGTAPIGLAGFAGNILAGAVALLLMSAVFGGRAWAITAGQPDGNGHPNVGAVIVYDSYGVVSGYPRVIPDFSGTLIHPRVFLTVGHGAVDIASGLVKVLGVSFEPVVDLNGVDPNNAATWPSSWRRVESCKYSYVRRDAHASRPLSDELQANPRTANPNEEDIAVLILEEPVTDIEPATLPSPCLLDYLKKSGQLEAPRPGGTLFTVVGYGFSLEFPPPQPIPPITADGKVIRKFAETGYLGLNDAWLITFQNPAAGYGGTGAGDSGGPTFWHDPATDKDVLVSLTSWGDPLCVAMDFSYRTDTAKSLQFIQEVIEGLPPESR
jgi:hypothetical protein